ncbi:SDR family NAD(P)-dependent oxidoreductase [Pseudorhizobium flavum]|jgi:NAD(P)-dependent dehydrogenase (short-subunit alcohol dehydrogenase family)|uniref:NAD(P)-dependent dehydrogenase (Short-subunit alcohol dehydrogenase family) n=1 Tax=Pseudorhizobium flavum TaxID=1335061 RepID=A0A7X0DDZ4_9HYPH|nr:SDR family oxidoreductase [Pseudorhizobium flavum]MBB6181235.1 NAD(P)-dependent dehydrogenase (short-subunit alcohol dehydrogenase family) [Pseudorhizobium flavum]CAD6601310.1 KR domain-containing protein [Pseudorhizobium flavum]
MSTNSSASSAEWARGWLEGRRVLVTGGTGGIGGAIARCFMEAGATVHATGATEQDCETAQAADPSGSIVYSVLDVRSNDAVTRFIGGLDDVHVVVNCAGVIRRGEERNPEVFDTVVDINLNGTMRVCEASLEKLAANGGSIINIASMLSFFGGGLVPGYSASKGGIAQLTKSLAIAYAPKGVRVNAIAPGWIATPLTQALQDDPARAGPILARTPMGRWGSPEDIQGLALFLSSPQAAFMTGTIIPVDGGYSIS